MKLSDIQNALTLARERFALPAEVTITIKPCIRCDGTPIAIEIILWKHCIILWSRYSATSLDDAMAGLAEYVNEHHDYIHCPPCPTCGHTEATP